jgi:hypothetical protein
MKKNTNILNAGRILKKIYLQEKITAFRRIPEVILHWAGAAITLITLGSFLLYHRYKHR